MKKNILLLLIFVVSALGVERKFLSPDEAFIYNQEVKADKVVVTLDLGKDIYLYDDKLNVQITKPKVIDITADLVFPEAKPYHEFIIHDKGISVNIPFALLKNKVDSTNYEIKFSYQGCSKAGLCYPPISKMINLENITLPSTTAVTSEGLNETDSIAATLKEGNILFVLLTFFGFGLLLSLTPCVFPMIPILSSIIVKAGDSGSLTASRGFFLSLIYVLAMAVAYTLAGVLAGLFGANLQVALQNPYVLVAFSAIFVALAFSMFGYFKLELPQSLQTKINKTTDGKEKQGVVGIAIMGFLSALIVGPCVAPPLAGALVYIGQTGDAFLGGAALFVMSLGMGVPLLLIGLGAGKYMPKPGGWMETITKIFGIVMLAIAIWMLDRVLNPIYTMFLWSFLLIGAALYIKIYEHIIVKLISTLLMIYGTILFVGAISGATNPLTPLEKFTQKGSIEKTESALKFKKVKNLDELKKEIEASTKPVILDFYADWCISCKEFENITFKDERVISKLNEFTLLKADVTKNSDEDKELQRKFEVVGPPAMIFWDSSNNEVKVAKIVGYKNPDEFLEILNKHF